jgi:predicted AlkP superfamily phosphohydrolase/phosphomutase
LSFLKNLIKKKNQRVVVIGLDGVPYTLLKKLAAKGVIPNIAKLMDRGSGHFKQMDVSIPEISSVSWASLMTGTNPARHGIYGFTDLKPQSYNIHFPSYSDLKEPTIWDKLGAEGKRSVVLNLPGTYPAREHNGILVSGFVAIDLRKAVFPHSLYEKLKTLDYRIDVDTTKAQNKDFFYNDLFETLGIRNRAFAELWKEECDLFVAVITETDRLQHFEWEAIEDESHPRHPRAMDFYSEVDRSVQQLLDLHGGNGGFFMMSDHGFCAIEEEVYLNRILKENGFLSWDKDPPESLNCLSADTRAFALDPSRIYIHSKCRFPKGAVDDKDGEKIKLELRDFFLNLTRNGKKVIKEIYNKEDIYDGPFLDKAPDLVLLSNCGFDLKGNIRSQVQFGRTHFSGMHTRDDAFLMSGAKIDKARPHIEDVSGMIIESVRQL